MANLSQTAANVRIRSAGPIGTGVCGETLTAGQPAYESAGKWYRAGAAGSAALANAQRIVIVGGTADTPCILAVPGCAVDLGATLAIGETYVVSATVGAIAPVADLVSTNRVTVLGIASTANSLTFRPVASGIQKA
jgi:hypothetical protein